MVLEPHRLPGELVPEGIGALGWDTAASDRADSELWVLCTPGRVASRADRAIHLYKHTHFID